MADHRPAATRGRPRQSRPRRCCTGRRPTCWCDTSCRKRQAFPAGRRLDVNDPYDWDKATGRLAEHVSWWEPGKDPADKRVGIIRGVSVTDHAEREWTAIAEAERYRRDAYVDIIKAGGGPPGLPPSVMNRSLERFATEVIPGLRAAIGQS